MNEQKNNSFRENKITERVFLFASADTSPKEGCHGSPEH